jgi:hypothetical protein
LTVSPGAPRQNIGRLPIVGRGTRLAARCGVEILVPVFIVFVLGQFVVGWLSTLLKRTRYWGLPAVLFGVLSTVAFAEGAAMPPRAGGGPPILDFGPWPSYVLAFTAFVAAVVALVAGSHARTRYLERQKAAPPELAVATARDHG